MKNITNKKLTTIKKKLKLKKSVKLRPLPISNINSVLVTSTKDGGQQKIGEKGNFETGNTGSKSNRNTYWKERVFTIRLDNEDVQLLWQQIEEGKLAMSFGYSFYADVIPGGLKEVKVSGNGVEQITIKEKLNIEEMSEHLDTIVQNLAIFGNAFEIFIDVKKYPELILKKDIMVDQMPPSLAPIEVSCFDFTSNLRPDLSLKIVDVEAKNIDGLSVSVSTEFQEAQPDLHTQHIRFPVAIDMEQPMRYRVTSYTREGEEKRSRWKIKKSCAESIDVTTPPEENTFAKIELEIEADSENFETNTLSEIQFVINYYLSNKKKQAVVSFAPDDIIYLKDLSFYYSKDKPIEYFINWIDNNQIKKQSRVRELNFEYYSVGTLEK